MSSIDIAWSFDTASQFINDLDIGLSELLTSQSEVLAELLEGLSTTITEISDGLDEEDRRLEKRTDEGDGCTFHVLEFAVVLLDDLEVAWLHVEATAGSDLTHLQAELLGQSGSPFPDRIVAERLCSPSVIARNASVMEHHSVAKIDVADMRVIGLESATGAAVDDKIWRELLDG